MEKLVSIVIPTWNHCDDLLKECIDSVVKSTTPDMLEKLEFIIISNGSTDNTEEYMRKLSDENPSLYTGMIFKEQLGFTKASNIGAKRAKGKYVLFLNNDVVFLEWGKPNEWINRMLEPFKDPQMGAVGPLVIFDKFSGHRFVVGFCLLTPAELLKKYNYFDEIYSPAGGEEIDYCVKLQLDGYKIFQCATTRYNGRTNLSDYPIWHKDNISYKKIPEYRNVICRRNGLLNLQKYNRSVKFNFGSGGIEIPGYVSVDLLDNRAALVMDVEKPMLDIPSDCAQEIVASHLIEHLNPFTIVETLKEWKRILKPGGKLIIEMPHIIKCAEWLLDSYYKPEKRKDLYSNLIMIYGAVNTKDSSSKNNITSPHLFGWCEDTIKEKLEEAGYVNFSFPPIQWPHPGPNFRVEAYKSGEKINVEKKNEVSLSGDLDGWSVTAVIPTKGRYYTTLPQCITSVINQTRPPEKIIIFDDGEQKDLRQDSLYNSIFKLIEERGIQWSVVFGKKKGMAEIDQLIVETCTTSWIWRLDDDNIAEPNVLERLIEVAKSDNKIGALASCAIMVNSHNKTWNKISSGDIRDIYFSPNVQWDKFDGMREVDHLHNTFLYKRKHAGHGYNCNLTPISHREETLFTWGIKKKGYKLVVVGDVVTWHMKQNDGGIRSYEIEQNMKKDEAIFVEQMKRDGIQFRETKMIALDNGIGDHYAFKHILPELRKRYGRIILATCYPEVFHDCPDITQISIQDIKNLGHNMEQYSVYKWMTDNKWDKSIVDAFRKMYL